MLWIILGVILILVAVFGAMYMLDNKRKLLKWGIIFVIALILCFIFFWLFNTFVAPKLSATPKVEKTIELVTFADKSTDGNKYCWGCKTDDGMEYFVINKIDRQVVSFTSEEARIVFIDEGVPRVEHYHYYLDSSFDALICGEYYCGDYCIYVPTDGYFEE